jgi:peptidoglycan/xylan/chitin deacetylase (PgdA/CDA1 family)
LPKEFRRGGFTYKQIVRERDVAIYQQTWNGCRNPSISYEVIRVRRREGFQIVGRWVPPAEVYPRSEQWGELGWTVNRSADHHRYR